jgi:2-pyrone-4,6-dicarboxylate lactonase
VLPAGACDAHCRVFGPAWIFSYAADRAYAPPNAPKETLAAMHKFLGISRAVIVQASCHGVDTRATLDAIVASDGRYRSIAIVDES